MLDAIALKFVGVGGAEDLVAGEFGGDDLADDVFVGEADYEAVFGGVVLVFGLGDETFAGVVVGLALSAALVFCLVAAVERWVNRLSERVRRGRDTHLK